MNIVELRDLCNKLIADGVDGNLAICLANQDTMMTQNTNAFEINELHLFQGNYIRYLFGTALLMEGQFLIFDTDDDIDASGSSAKHIRQLA